MYLIKYLAGLIGKLAYYAWGKPDYCFECGVMLTKTVLPYRYSQRTGFPSINFVFIQCKTPRPRCDRYGGFGWLERASAEIEIEKE